MSKKRHGDEWVSLSTGEVVAVQRGVRYPNGLAFMTIFQSGLQHLAKLDLTGRECRVLFALMAALDYENWVSISQQTIAEDIGLHQPAVASAIKRLCQEGVVEKQQDPSDRRRWRYRLSADLGWRGDAASWARHVASRDGDNIVRLFGKSS